MNTELRTKAKNDFEKGFLKLMKIQYLEKPWIMLESTDI